MPSYQRSDFISPRCRGKQDCAASGFDNIWCVQPCHGTSNDTGLVQNGARPKETKDDLCFDFRGVLEASG